MKQVFKTNIFKMFGAQTYGTALNILEKVVTVPLFLYYWGVNLYGIWLILRAIPSYMAIAEMGFATAASNRMAESLVENDIDDAVKSFQSVFMLLLFVSAFVMAVLFLVMHFVGFENILPVDTSNEYNIEIIVYTLVLYTLLVFQTQLMSAGFRSIEKYVKGTYFTYNIRAAELLVTVASLFSGLGLNGLSIALLLVRAIGTVFMAISLKIDAPWINFKIRTSNFLRLKEMLPDSLGFMGFPVAQALSLQGFVIVVGYLFTPAVVALFSTSRMLTRFILQLGMQLNRSIWPDLTTLYKKGDMDKAKKIFLGGLAIYVWGGSIASLILLEFSGTIFNVWTGNEIEYNSKVFMLLLICALINGLWFSAVSLLNATNSHKKVSGFYLVINIIAVPLAYFVGRDYGLESIGIILVVVEMLACIYVLLQCINKINIPLITVLKDIFFAPLFIIRHKVAVK